MVTAEVTRFSSTERLLHRVHATAFVIMLVSGLCLYLPALAELVGRRGLFKTIHFYTAVVWLVALVAVVVAGNRRSLLALAREVDRFDLADRAWFKDRGRPPTARLNAGQKLFTIVTAAFAVLFTVTGFLLWFGERDTRFRFANTLLIHDWVMYVSAFLFLGHLWMAYTHRTRRTSPD